MKNIEYQETSIEKEANKSKEFKSLGSIHSIKEKRNPLVDPLVSEIMPKQISNSKMKPPADPDQLPDQNREGPENVKNKENGRVSTPH